MESTYLQGAWPVGGEGEGAGEGERERDRGERGNKAIGIINAPSPPALLLICLKLYSFVQPVDHVQRHSSYHAGGLLHSFPSCLLLSHVVLSLYLYYYTTWLWESMNVYKPFSYSLTKGRGGWKEKGEEWGHWRQIRTIASLKFWHFFAHFPLPPCFLCDGPIILH